MKRCFAFGCSYTGWNWPTVADFVGVNFDEYYNCGQGGNSNSLIQKEVILAHKKFNFTKDDYIIIGVTGIGRESLIEESKNNFKLTRTGDIFPNPSTNHPESSKCYANLIDNWSFALWRSVSAIETIKIFLDVCKVPYKIYPAIYFDNNKFNTHKGRLEQFNKLQSFLDIKESIDDFWITTNEPSTRTFITGETDGHPSQTVHFKYFEKHFGQFYGDKSVDLYKKTSTILNNSMADQSSSWSLLTKKYGFYREDICKRNF